MSHRNSSLNEKITHLKLDNLKNVITNDDKNGSAQVLLGSAGATAILADSTITPIKDLENRDGWNFVNSVNATKFNLYFYDGSQESLKLSEINSVFAKVYINNFSNLNCCPFLQIYTKPTGSGDAGAFYHSRITYQIDNTAKIGVGEQVILYGINIPNTNCNNRKIQLKTKTVSGDGGNDEEVLYIVLASDSAATINTKNLTITSMGFNTIEFVDDGIINRDFKLLTENSINYERSGTITLLDNDYLASSMFSSSIDLNGYKGISLYGTLTSSHPFYISVSGDNTNFYTDTNNMAVAVHGSNYEFFESYENLPRYVRILNGNTGNNFTLHYNLYR